MSTQPSLTDLNGIMKAAEAESVLMTGTPETIPSLELASLPETDIMAEVKEALKTVNMSDVKTAATKPTIANVLERMSNDPDELNRVLDNASPDMMEQARKLVAGGQANEIMREMQRRGIDPHAMRAQMQEQQRALRGLSSKSTDSTRKVIMITANRQLKSRSIPQGSEKASAGALLKSVAAVEISCSRLATGPLTGRSIKIWYDPEVKGKNRRASKIVGFPIAGQILVINDEGDLTEADFLAAEALLA